MPITCNSTGTAQQGPQQHQPPRPTPPWPHTLTQCPPALGPGSACPRARSCPSLPHQPLPLLPSTPMSPFSAPAQMPPGPCSPCPAPRPSPGSAPPSAPLEGSRCPRPLWGVPLSPPALPCVGTPRLTHESPRAGHNPAPAACARRAAGTHRAPRGHAGRPWLSRSAPAISRAWLPGGRKVPPTREELGSQQHHHTEVTIQSGALGPGQGEIPPPAANGPRPHPEAER